MGRRGPAPKPTKLKKLEGTYRKDRDIGRELTPPPGVPEPPAWMRKKQQKLALAEWDRVVPQLAELGVLTGLDGGALERYCVAHSNWVKAQADVDAKGMVLKTPFGPQKNPSLKIALEERNAARQLAAELGLSPSARSRVKVPEKKADGDATGDFLFGPPQLVKTEPV